MNDPIISREHIRAKARAAFEAGKPRGSHNMNWNAAALPTWLGEYDRLVRLAELVSNRREVSA